MANKLDEIYMYLKALLILWLLYLYNIFIASIYTYGYVYCIGVWFGLLNNNKISIVVMKIFWLSCMDLYLNWNFMNKIYSWIAINWEPDTMSCFEQDKSIPPPIPFPLETVTFSSSTSMQTTICSRWKTCNIFNFEINYIFL